MASISGILQIFGNMGRLFNRTGQAADSAAKAMNQLPVVATKMTSDLMIATQTITKFTSMRSIKQSSDSTAQSMVKFQRMVYTCTSVTMQFRSSVSYAANSAKQLGEAAKDSNKGVKRVAKFLDELGGKLRQAADKIEKSAKDAGFLPNSDKNSPDSSNNGEKKSSNKFMDGAKKWIPKGFSMAKQHGGAVLNAAMEQEQLKDAFIARAGNEEVGTAMFEKFRKDALRTGADVKEYLTGTLQNFSLTKNTDQISELNLLANKLRVFDTSGKGMEGSFETVRKALAGDLGSLAAQLNLPLQALESFKLGEFASKGDFDGFVSAFNQLLESRGMGQEAFETMMDSPVNKWQTLLGNFNTMLATIGTKALEALAPLMDTLNAAFESGQFDPFINALASGLEFLAFGFEWLVLNIPPAWEVIKQVIAGVATAIRSLAIILIALSPLIIGITVAWQTYSLITRVVGMVSGFAATALRVLGTAISTLGKIMGKHPIIFFVSIIIGIISAILAFQSVTGGLRKVFSQAFGFIVDVAEGAVNFIIGLVNGLISGINSIAGFFGRLLGIEEDLIPEIEFKADFSEFKKAGQEFIEDFTLDDIKAKFGLEEPSIGNNNHSEDLLGGWNSGITDSPFMGQAPSMDSIGKVGEVGKINNTVEVASEDLEIMRELAEIESIQNFVTLTPTVHMQTGDINNGYDAETIIRRIEQKLEEEFVSAAEGVYG